MTTVEELKSDILAYVNVRYENAAWKHPLSATPRYPHRPLKKYELVSLGSKLSGKQLDGSRMNLTGARVSLSTMAGFEYAPVLNERPDGTKIIEPQSDRPFRKGELESLLDALENADGTEPADLYPDDSDDESDGAPQQQPLKTNE